MGAVSLGDDPDSPRQDVVGAEDAVALAQGDLVLAEVEGAEISPVTCRVTSQQVKGVRTRLREEFQGPRSSHNLAEGERRPHRPLLASKAILEGFEAMFGSVTSRPPPRTARLTGAPSPLRGPPD